MAEEFDRFVNLQILRWLLCTYIEHTFLEMLKNYSLYLKSSHKGFPGGSVVKNPPANAGDTGSIPDPERSHMPLHYNCWACALDPGSHSYWACMLQLKTTRPRVHGLQQE